MIKRNFFLLIILFYSAASTAQSYNPAIDVQHYGFELEVNDVNNNLTGLATIRFIMRQNASSISLDLVGKNKLGQGMIVTSVKSNDVQLDYQQVDNKLIIGLPPTANSGDTINCKINYSGIPADGLVFSQNKFKQRTIFADNWPNRARYWLPCVDHLSDKASVDFMVTAPAHYSLISNGVLVEESVIGANKKFTHWRETVALPTKVMVIGLADFAINVAGSVDCIPVSSWVFPQHKKEGFYDYAQALEVLPFFIKSVGPYAYKKLANVEAITIFGGMENAGAIFYNERSITGKRGYSEELIAHEIAHQWFGNSATESGWPHVWLSEGFATAMTNLYLEQKYGRDSLDARLKKDRAEIFLFEKVRFTPIVDSSEKENFMVLLNKNSYEKGGWVLHMLRRKLGDSLFWKGIRNYYSSYAGKNASTDDFRKEMEAAAGVDLHEFFQQWLYRPGHPSIAIKWTYNAVSHKLLLQVTQLQEKLFSFPLELAFNSSAGNGQSEATTWIKDRTTQLQIALPAKPNRVIADPFTNLLIQSTVLEDKAAGL